MYKTFKAHKLGITKIDIHPKKSVLATVSDDKSWKLWSILDGKFLMGGEGHTEWVSGVKFHPKGKFLATCSADNTVKLWDFSKNGECVSTFKEHTQVVWNVDFN